MSTQVLSNSEPVARKEHDCIWCNEKIQPGEKYHIQTCVFDGEWQANKYHMECYTAAVGYWDMDDGGFPAHAFKRGTAEEA